MSDITLQPRGPAGTPGTQIREISSVSQLVPGFLNDGDFAILIAGVRTVLYGPKSGGVWPPRGVRLGGDRGPQGVSGTNGLNFLAMAGAPSPEDGRIGEVWLDVTADPMMFYGPKTVAGWGEGVSFDGVDGTSLIAEAGDPPPDAGKLGDSWINTATMQLYGPKTEAGWGLPKELHGEDGLNLHVAFADPGPDDGEIGEAWINRNTMTFFGPKTGGGWGGGISIVGPPGPIAEWTGGTWDADTVYGVNAGVDYLGASYVSLHAGNVGNTPQSGPPATDAHWQLIAAPAEGTDPAAIDARFNAAEARLTDLETAPPAITRGQILGLQIALGG